MEIFYPVAALVALTFAVLFLTGFVRLRAAFAGALRFAHTAVHLTYNNVLHRLIVFATSNLVLIAIWVRFIWQLR